MNFDFLPVEKENIKYRPDSFSIEIEEVILLFVINWNVVDGRFYFDLYQHDETPIILGKKIVYGRDILNNVHDEYLPENVYIVPEDLSGKSRQEGITYDNFMEDVKMYIFSGSDN